MSEEPKFDRRRFLAIAAMSVTAVAVGMIVAADGQSNRTNPASKTASTPGKISFGALKQIDAGVLNVSYAKAGRSDGRPVILLHGRPYDIHSYINVARLLASAGSRVVIRICADTARRAFFQAKRSATASRRRSLSTASLWMDALKLDEAIVAGFDWGAQRTSWLPACAP